jgi:hypothetical protein
LRKLYAQGVLQKTYQVRVFQLLNYLDIIQLDVQVLVHALQRSTDLDVVLELNGDLMVDEGLEEAGTR